MKAIELGNELKQDAIGSIKRFFQQERDEELSDFQAATILEFILAELAPPIYNQALADAHTLMSKQIEELYGLQKYPRSSLERLKK
ncbi:MAG: hypothetical protein H6Q76_2148 [Firmicutes bacterium]|nr:hypothetical protein [Bacillota bacterium]